MNKTQERTETGRERLSERKGHVPGIRGLVAGLLAGCCAWWAVAGEARGQTAAPLNPEFLRWMENQTRESSGTGKPLPRKRVLASGEEEEYAFGHVPGLVDYAYLKDINFAVGDQLGDAAGDALPSRFDLRDEGRMTSVKDQNPYGTCWAHAALGSLESALLTQKRGAYDFSEKHLANTHGRDWGFSEGGNVSIALAYLTRWSGPIAEAEDPYPDSSYYRTWYQNGQKGKITVSPSPAGTPLGHIQNAAILTPMDTASDTEEIKRFVKNGGGVYASYTHVWAAYRGTNFYWNGAQSLLSNGDGGHAVLIVGWDDSYSRKNFKYAPPGDGAFLAKNSWGPTEGEKGCFWVSYHDATFGRSELCAFDEMEATNNYGGVYFHDPLGQVSNLGWGTPSRWGANEFVARKNERIAAVGFYANVPSTKYEISVYTGCTASDPTAGTKQTSQTGTTDHAGYVTVKLDSEVSVKEGQRFSVVFKLTTPGYNYPLAFEACYQYTYNGKKYWTPTSEASASPGESFVSADGRTWSDFTKLYPNGNLCFKAYTKSATAEKPKLSDVSIRGAKSVESGGTGQYWCDAVYGDNSRKEGVKAAWAVSNGGEWASIDAQTGLLTAREVAETRTVTIRATYTDDGVTKSGEGQVQITAGAPETPSGVTATTNNAQVVRVEWNPSKGATEYAVYRGETADAKNAQHVYTAGTCRFNDQGAVPGDEYWYFVKAKNGSGTAVKSSGFSTGAKGWRPLLPPQEISATTGLTDRIEIAWAAAEGAACYRVARATAPGGPWTWLGAWQEALAFTDRTCASDTAYYYRVSAAKDSTGRKASDGGAYAEGRRPSPVVAVSLDVLGPGSLAGGAEGRYEARVRYSDKTVGAAVVAAAWTVTAGNVRTEGTTGVVTAPTPAENGELTVGAAWEGLSGTTKVAVKAVVPARATGLKVVSATAAGVELAWTAVAGAGGYVVSRTGGSEGTATFKAAGTTYTDTTAGPGVEYSYTVAAENSAGTGETSEPVAVFIALAVPGGVTATTNRTDGVRVAWQAVAGASHYRVARATSAAGTKTLLGSWQTGTAHLDTAATAGTTYHYFVLAATDSAGTHASGYSAGVQGVRKAVVTLSSISISGPDKVPASEAALYSCTAAYSDGTRKDVVPSWSVAPSGAASIDRNGRLSAKAVAADTTVTVSASFADGVTQTAAKSVLVVAPKPATAEVTDVTVSTRWPFAPLVDIDYTLVTAPAAAKATVAVSGQDNDHARPLAAKTLSGDGADGSAIPAGRHRLTWNIGADHPCLHARDVDVALTASVAADVTVTFDGNGGTPSVASKGYAVSGPYGTLPTATRSGWRFAGWSTGKNSGLLVTADSPVPDSPVTLHALWKSTAEPVWTIQNGVLTAVNLNGATAIEIPATVTAIGTNVFDNCTTLKSVVFTPGVMDIGADAFIYCSNLETAIFAEGLKSIAWYSFGHCRALKQICIPASVSSISSFGFVYCNGLEKVDVAAGNKWYESDIGIAYNKGKTAIVLLPANHPTTEFSIPDTVVYIDACAFSDCTNLSSITIPSSVTSIGGWAFDGCTSLENLEIPSSVTYIGPAAFRSTPLKSFNWPAAVATIDQYMFQGCTHLSSVSIPCGVKLIDGGAFSSCRSLEKIVFPSSVTNIESWRVFEYCSSLTNVTFMGALARYDGYTNFYANTPTSLVTWVTEKWTGPTDTWNGRAVRVMPEPAWTIENGVLLSANLNGATDVEIPSSVRSIGNSALQSQYEMTSLSIPNTVTNIGRFAIAYCNGLTTLAIPPSCKSLGEYAVYACRGLEAVSIPDGVVSLDSYAFKDCSSLLSAFVPASVTNIGWGVFSSCSNLLGIAVDGRNPAYCAHDGMLLTKDKTTLLTCPASYRSVTIPPEVTCLDFWAFGDCAKLTSITIPNGVTLMKQSVFRNCTGLTSVTIPSSVTNIWAAVFQGCSGLTTVHIPASLTSLDGSAFGECINLTDITVDAGNPNYCSDGGILYSKDKTRLLSCPAGKDSATIPFGVQTINYNAFYGCSRIASISIPSSVTFISSYAFCGCSGLKSVEIAHGLENIANEVFRGCSSLVSISLPASVTRIGAGAFQYCRALKSVTILGALESYTGSGYIFDQTPTDLVVHVTPNWTGPTPTWCGRTVVMDAAAP
jgi:C1A family cysteine protease/fibronectin type 3 domain-containing protein